MHEFFFEVFRWPKIFFLLKKAKIFFTKIHPKELYGFRGNIYDHIYVALKMYLKKVSRLANAMLTSFTSEPFWKPKSTLS